jgi:hypothetical protein
MFTGAFDVLFFTQGLFKSLIKKFQMRFFVVAGFVILSVLFVRCDDKLALPINKTDFLKAFTSTFARSDLAEIASEKTPSVQWIKDVMERQGISFNATALRKLSDSELLAIAMRAAITGISHWKRSVGTDIILVDYQTGIPYPENMTLDLEVPIYISVICVMVFTIVLQHMRLHRTGDIKSKDLMTAQSPE